MASNIGRQMAIEEAKRAGIPVDFFLRLVQQESGWNPQARSPVGAYGLTQAMPATWKSPGFGVQPGGDINDPREQLRFGADYSRAMLDRYNGDPVKAAAAYNWGAGNADKWSGDLSHLPAETRDYVQKVGMGGIADFSGPETIADIPEEDMGTSIRPDTDNAIMDRRSNEGGVTIHPGLGLQSLGAALSAAARGQSANQDLARIRKAYFDERQAEAEKAQAELQRTALVEYFGKDSAVGRALAQGASAQDAMQIGMASEQREFQRGERIAGQEFSAGQSALERAQRAQEFGISTGLDIARLEQDADQFATTEGRLSAGQADDSARGWANIGMQGEELGMRRDQAETEEELRIQQGAAFKQALRAKAAATGNVDLVKQIDNMPDTAFADDTARMYADLFFPQEKGGINIYNGESPEGVAAANAGAYNKALSDKMGEEDAKYLGTLRTAADAGNDLSASLDQMEEILDKNEDLDTGRFYQYAAPVVEGLRMVGAIPEDFVVNYGDRASLEKLNNYMSTYVRQAGAGATSDFDAKMYINTSPGPNDTRAVMKARIGQIRQINARKNAMADFIGTRAMELDQNGRIIGAAKARQEWRKMLETGDPRTIPSGRDYTKMTKQNLSQIPLKVGDWVRAPNGKMVKIVDDEGLQMFNSILSQP